MIHCRYRLQCRILALFFPFRTEVALNLVAMIFFQLSVVLTIFEESLNSYLERSKSFFEAR